MSLAEEMPEDEFPEFVMRAFRAVAIEMAEKDHEIDRLKGQVDILQKNALETRIKEITRDYEEAKLFRALAELRAPTDEQSAFYVRTASGKLCLQENEEE